MIVLGKKQQAATGRTSPKTKEVWRKCWQCDCDGHSHKSAGFPLTGAHLAITGIKSHIETLTGHKPVSCPWRVFFDPFVSEIVKIANLSEKGMGASYLGSDPAAILYDGLDCYLSAKATIANHDEEQRRKERQKSKGPKR